MSLRPEDQLQIATMRYLRHALPQEAVVTGIEHAQRMTKVAGAVRKAKGVTAGLADIMIWLPHRFVAVELKTADGVQSDSQRLFQQRITALGHHYLLCRSVTEVARGLEALGVPLAVPTLSAEVTDMRLEAAREARAGARGAAPAAAPKQPRPVSPERAARLMAAEYQRLGRRT